MSSDTITVPTAAPAGEKKNWRDTPQGKYNMFHMGIGKTNADTHSALLKLADDLGCKPAALGWYAIEEMLKNPPSEAPEGAAQGNQGSAAGFWTVPEVDGNGRAVGLSVVHVARRTQVQNGRNFYRYTRDDEAGMERARRQAQRAAEHDCQLMGIDPDTLTFTDLATND